MNFNLSNKIKPFFAVCQKTITIEEIITEMS